MIKVAQITTLILIFFCLQVNARHINYDSLGITKKAGKTFIIHHVDEGETLFSLSRRYNVKVDEIMQENPEAEGGLKIGQKILIPIPENSQKAKPEGKVHTVQPSETLYSIARTYSISVAELKEWNSLTDNNIGVGDKLVIKTEGATTQTISEKPVSKTVDYSGKKTHRVEASETLYSLSKLYNVEVEDIKKWNNLSGNDLSIGQVLIMGTSTTVEPAVNSTMLPPVVEQTAKDEISVNNQINVSDIKVPEVSVGASNSATKTLENNKIIENGFAEVIDGSGETKKYLALHRTAPIGTIIQVRNDMNNQIVFVRVVGSIPDTGDNNKILIKISKKAFDRLGSVDSRFPVEISYIP